MYNAESGDTISIKMEVYASETIRIEECKDGNIMVQQITLLYYYFQNHISSRL